MSHGSEAPAPPGLRSRLGSGLLLAGLGGGFVLLIVLARGLGIELPDLAGLGGPPEEATEKLALPTLLGLAGLFVVGTVAAAVLLRRGLAGGDGTCPPWPGFTDVLGGFVAYLAAQWAGLVIVGLGLGPERRAAGWGERASDVAAALATQQLVAGILAVAAFLLIARVSAGRPLGRAFDRGGRLGRELGWALAAYALFLPAVLALAPVLVALGMEPPAQRVSGMVLGAFASGVGGQLVVTVFTVAVAPIAEELLFRGLLQKGLRPRLGRIGSVATAALLFTAVHIEDGGIGSVHVSILLLGLFLGSVYELSGRLRLCIALHVLHNAITLLVLLVSV
jgi:membrane protease YdiL (CAAX protease family)